MTKGDKFTVQHDGWKERIEILSSGPKFTTYEYKWRGKDWHRDGTKREPTDRVRAMIQAATNR